MKLNTFMLLLYIWSKKEVSLTQIEKRRNVNYQYDPGLEFLTTEGFIEGSRVEGNEVYFVVSEEGSGYVWKRIGAGAAGIIGAVNVFDILFL